MPEGKTFGSFTELARHARAEDMKHGVRGNTGPTRESNRELFREILEGNFDQVPPGEFIVDQKNIDTVSIGRVGGSDAEPEQLFATFFYKNENGRPASFTWSIGQDGTFSGEIPKGVSMNRLELTRTVLDIEKKIGVGVWHMVNDEFLGQSDPGFSRERGDGEEPVQPRPGLDPERVEFLVEQPGLLTGFVSEKLGFNGYRAGVFPDRIVLEHPRYGNAAYVVYLDRNILTDKQLTSRDIQSRLTEEESQYVREQYWNPIGRQAETKKELRSLPGLTVKKITHGGKDWKARLAAAIKEPRPEKV